MLSRSCIRTAECTGFRTNCVVFFLRCYRVFFPNAPEMYGFGTRSQNVRGADLSLPLHPSLLKLLHNQLSLPALYRDTLSKKAVHPVMPRKECVPAIILLHAAPQAPADCHLPQKSPLYALLGEVAIFAGRSGKPLPVVVKLRAGFLVDLHGLARPAASGCSIKATAIIPSKISLISRVRDLLNNRGSGFFA